MIHLLRMVMTPDLPTKRYSGSDYSPFALAHDTPSCACCRDRQGHTRQALVESVDMFGAFLCNGHTVSAGGQRGACGTTKSPFGTANRLCPMAVAMSAARGSTEISSVYRGSGLRGRR